jgi:hypothetical protein
VKFMKELWSLLLSAQQNASGVPQQFLDGKSDLRRSYKEALMDGRSTACGADVGDDGWVKVVGRRSRRRSPCPPLPLHPQTRSR